MVLNFHLLQRYLPLKIGNLVVIFSPAAAASSSDIELQGSVLTVLSVGPLTSDVVEFVSAAPLSAAENLLPVVVGS